MKPGGQPYRFIEVWWGEPLSSELLDRINLAPNKQLRTFSRDYRPEISLNELPEIDDGHIRPLLRSGSVPQSMQTSGIPFSIALNVLLYAHELILDDPLYPWVIEHGDMPLLRRGFADLLALKPFYDSGIVYFGPISSMARHPSIVAPSYIELDDVNFTDQNPQDIVFDVIGGISLAKLLDGRAHPMAYGYQEFEIMSSLLRRTRFDKGYLNLTTLASMNVPRVEGQISDLIAVRRSSEDFALWRDALSRALSQIAGISNTDEDWQGDALTIMQTELAPLREKIQKATNRSPTLTALQAGVSGLSIGALGTLTGWAAGGSLIPSLATAGAVTGLGTVTSYVKAMKAKHRNRAILDLALAFQPDVQ